MGRKECWIHGEAGLYGLRYETVMGGGSWTSNKPVGGEYQLHIPHYWPLSRAILKIATHICPSVILAAHSHWFITSSDRPVLLHNQHTLFFPPFQHPCAAQSHLDDLGSAFLWSYRTHIDHMAHTPWRPLTEHTSTHVLQLHTATFSTKRRWTWQCSTEMVAPTYKGT